MSVLTVIMRHAVYIALITIPPRSAFLDAVLGADHIVRVVEVGFKARLRAVGTVSSRNTLSAVRRIVTFQANFIPVGVTGVVTIDVIILWDTELGTIDTMPVLQTRFLAILCTCVVSAGSVIVRHTVCVALVTMPPRQTVFGAVFFIAGVVTSGWMVLRGTECRAARAEPAWATCCALRRLPASVANLVSSLIAVVVAFAVVSLRNAPLGTPIAMPTG